MATRKIGRNAGTGKFMPVKKAQEQKRTAIVETIKTALRQQGKKPKSAAK